LFLGRQRNVFLPSRASIQEFCNCYACAVIIQKAPGRIQATEACVRAVYADSRAIRRVAVRSPGTGVDDVLIRPHGEVANADRRFYERAANRFATGYRGQWISL